MPKSTQIFINHQVAELEGIEFELLNNPQQLLETTHKVAKQLNLTVVNSFVHRFEPHGLSLVLVLSQSHIAIHTWPEHGYLHMDMVTCSEGSETDHFQTALQNSFSPSKITSKKISY